MAGILIKKKCCCGVEPALGACCLPDRSCQDGLTELECNGAAGEWFPGEQCADVRCDEPTGCCFPDGSCEDLLPADCKAAGGAVRSLVCSQVVCPIPVCVETGEQNDEACLLCPDEFTVTVNGSTTYFLNEPFGGSCQYQAVWSTIPCLITRTPANPCVWRGVLDCPPTCPCDVCLPLVCGDDLIAVRLRLDELTLQLFCQGATGFWELELDTVITPFTNAGCEGLGNAFCRDILRFRQGPFPIEQLFCPGPTMPLISAENNECSGGHMVISFDIGSATLS